MSGMRNHLKYEFIILFQSKFVWMMRDVDGRGSEDQ
jgi:hypothetical protein